MSKSQKYKRLLHLHLLGIPIRKPYGNIFDKLLEFFEHNKVVKIIDKDGHDNICHLNDSNEIVYVLKRAGHEELQLNYKYCLFVISICVKHFSPAIIDEMAQIVFSYKKIKFDELNVSAWDVTIDTHFVELHMKHQSGDFENLEC